MKKSWKKKIQKNKQKKTHPDAPMVPPNISVYFEHGYEGRYVVLVCLECQSNEDSIKLMQGTCQDWRL